ncbi:MAG: radical SAM protein, partial [Collinsella sp.]|nr:radical SAM protein [Collinsella sp.]
MSTFLNASPIFGPVRSRRLGLSLGVNMMPASGKICTFDCIYCENGLNAERPCHEPYNTAAVVLDALEAKLREMAAEGELPDVITFAGNGEPTAAPEFPQAIAGAVALRDQLAPNSKIAVLSNGTRADRPEVHDALMMVDDNILKLDTVDPAFIQLLDQPVGPYDVEHQIETFASFDGHVIIQTIFLTGEYQGKPLAGYYGVDLVIEENPSKSVKWWRDKVAPALKAANLDIFFVPTTFVQARKGGRQEAVDASVAEWGDLAQGMSIWQIQTSPFGGGLQLLERQAQAQHKAGKAWMTTVSFHYWWGSNRSVPTSWLWMPGRPL